ncbi:MAG: hypothetical protein QMC80_07420, partial [Thermoplasmatales archaeon]|nr:hypothetical protein [Thermoplasmatales archaeon]
MTSTMECIKSITEPRLSKPGPGRTIVNSIKEWTEGLIDVRFKLIENAKKMGINREIETFYMAYFEAKIPVIEQKELRRNEIELTTNAVLSTWLMAVSSGYITRKSSLYDSICWFINVNNNSDLQVIKTWLSSVDIRPIQNLSYDNRFLDLYPYILEVFETDDEIFLKGSQRLKKRKYGIYYTPSDVAFYMVRNTAEKGENDYRPLSWIDPACGTGIFLRTIMEYYLKYKKTISNNISSLLEFFIHHIYGIDISKVAVQSSTFTILTFCLSECSDKISSPWEDWQKIRGNIVCFDSTKIDSTINKVKDIDFKRRRIETKEKRNLDSQDDNAIINPPISPSITDVFPEVEDGFTHFVTNPPYSKSIVNMPRTQKTLFDEQIDIPLNGNPLFLDFIRMMWLFCNSKRRSCSIVCPLSLTYNSGKPFINIRKQLSKKKGDWYFANFDRTPDSLFGDDVKTRNTIILHNLNYQNSNSTSFYTTSLLRWNSRKRDSFFESISFTELKRNNTTQLIPKIGSKIEMEVYNALLEDHKSNEVINFSKKGGQYQHPLYIGKTSYNWLAAYPINPFSNIQDSALHSTLDLMHFERKEDMLLMFGL